MPLARTQSLDHMELQDKLQKEALLLRRKQSKWVLSKASHSLLQFLAVAEYI